MSRCASISRVRCVQKWKIWKASLRPWRSQMDDRFIWPHTLMRPKVLQSFTRPFFDSKESWVSYHNITPIRPLGLCKYIQYSNIINNEYHDHARIDWQRWLSWLMTDFHWSRDILSVWFSSPNRPHTSTTLFLIWFRTPASSLSDIIEKICKLFKSLK